MQVIDKIKALIRPSKLVVTLILCVLSVSCSHSNYIRHESQHSLKQNKLEKSKPNFVIILADDLGFTDVNYFASRLVGKKTINSFFETPQIDLLASQGASFKQAYAHQLCSPTRAALLTGKNSAEIGFTTAMPSRSLSYYVANLPVPENYHPLDVLEHKDALKEEPALINGISLSALPAGTSLDAGLDETTFAEALEGYNSAFVGKWHIGGHGASGYQPQNQGFNVLAYYDAGGSHYYNWVEKWNRKALLHKSMPQQELAIGDAGSPPTHEYLTDDLTEKSVNFIREAAHSRKPFLLFLSHFAVHSPLQAPKKDVEYFNRKASRGKEGKGNAAYAAMVKRLDSSVGTIIESLKASNLYNNTYIIFLSDNGGVDYLIGNKKLAGHKPKNNNIDGFWTPTSNAPLKGGKATLFEGGVRVPLIISGPGIEAGQWVDRPVFVTDIFPTLVELSGSKMSQHRIEGQSLLSLMNMKGFKSEYSRDTYYWHYPFNVIVENPDNNLPLSPHSAIRVGPYKLIVDWHGEQKLYNIDKDPFETDNLALSEPKIVQVLQQKLVDWIKANVAHRYRAKPNPAYDSQNSSRPAATRLNPSYF